ncbi:MAG TPA: hypothetical protein VGM93_14925, partial [Acidimicrobiales bacterium]
GASGEKAMPPIVARHADEWNVWGTPERFKAKTAVMSAACEAIDRDPASLKRSTQALMFIGPEGAATAERIGGDRVVGGTSAQLIEIVAEYAAAGLDELIVPTFTFRTVEQAKEAAEQIITEVAPTFRSA